MVLSQIEVIGQCRPGRGGRVGDAPGYRSEGTSGERLTLGLCRSERGWETGADIFAQLCEIVLCRG